MSHTRSWRTITVVGAMAIAAIAVVIMASLVRGPTSVWAQSSNPSGEPPLTPSLPDPPPNADADSEGITLGVSPPNLEVAIDPQGTTGAFRAFNLGTRSVTIQTSIAPWTLDSLNQIELVVPTEQTLDQWLLLSPSTFTIPPGEEQVVRFSIRPRIEPEPGEHRAMVFLEPVADPSGQSVTATARIGVAIYGAVGDIDRQGTLHTVNVRSADRSEVVANASDLLVSFDISSEGLNHIRLDGQYSIWQADRYPGTTETHLMPIGNETGYPDGLLLVAPLPSTPVLPSTRRTLMSSIPLSLASGDYVLDIQGQLGDDSIERNVPFSVSP